MDEQVTFESGGTKLSGLWTSADQPVAMAAIAHGAGNDMRHPFYAGIAESLARVQVSSLRFNFPFTEIGRKSPDRPPVLHTAWQAASAEAHRLGPGLPLVATGKSMGGRIASMLAAEDDDAFPARALVFFGYPLHAPGRTEQPRDGHLPSIRVPMLFIQGTADPLANFDLIQALMGRLGPTAHLHVVEGGDHSFRVRGHRRPDDEIGRELGAVAAQFVHNVVRS